MRIKDGQEGRERKRERGAELRRERENHVLLVGSGRKSEMFEVTGTPQWTAMSERTDYFLFTCRLYPLL